MSGIFVVPEASQPAWGEIPQDESDWRPPAFETVEHRSEDNRFAVGFWKRGPEEGEMVLSDFHEVMFIIDGQIEITPEDGEPVLVGPGDLVIAPQDSRGTWKALTPVRKFWAIYREH